MHSDSPPNFLAHSWNVGFLVPEDSRFANTLDVHKNDSRQFQTAAALDQPTHRPIVAFAPSAQDLSLPCGARFLVVAAVTS